MKLAAARCKSPLAQPERGIGERSGLRKRG
jgi:hypothetical protein